MATDIGQIQGLLKSLGINQIFASVSELYEPLKRWQKEYNEEYSHSSLGWFMPYKYERWITSCVTMQVAQKARYS